MSLTVNNCERLQFVNDITIYQDCKVKDIVQATNHLQCELCHLLKSSEETNLVFKQRKTKFMIVGTKQCWDQTIGKSIRFRPDTDSSNLP